MTRLAQAAALLSLAACATPGTPVSLAAARDGGPSGRIVLDYGAGGHEVAFAPDRVRGEILDLARQDGGWAGQVAAKANDDVRLGSGLHTLVTVAPGRIAGPGVDLYLNEDAAAQALTITGWVAGRKVRIAVTPDAIEADALMLKKIGENVWRDENASITLTVEGDAALRSPQFVLALVSALPGRPTLFANEFSDAAARAEASKRTQVP